MTPEYQQKYAERQKALEDIYAPQISGLQAQISQLPQQYEAQKSALQQAKENAFRDITKTAARGGMYFTGFTPREEARYLGERYLPGLQQLGAQETSARQGLLNQIAAVQGQQKAAGLSYLDQLAAWQRADELAAQQAAARAAASAGGFSLGDLGLGGDLGAGTGGITPTPAAKGPTAAEQFNKALADTYTTFIKEGNRAKIKTLVDQNMNIINSASANATIKKLAQDRMNLLQAVAKANNYDLNKLQPSRAEAVLANPVVNRLTLTPSEYVNQIKTNINTLKNAYNWMFGGR